MGRVIKIRINKIRVTEIQWLKTAMKEKNIPILEVVKDDTKSDHSKKGSRKGSRRNSRKSSRKGSSKGSSKGSAKATKLDNELLSPNSRQSAYMPSPANSLS